MKKATALILGLCTFTLAACNGMTTSETTSNIEVAPDAALEQAANDVKTYDLMSQSNSGQTGTMTLSENEEGKVVVTLALMGGNFTAPQPAHIHIGHCPEPGAVQYPLTNVVNGASTTTLDVNMSEFLAAPELSVNVHKSAAEAKTYTACGDIK